MGRHVSPASPYTTKWLLKYRWEMKDEYHCMATSFPKSIFSTSWELAIFCGCGGWGVFRWQGHVDWWLRAQPLDWNVWIHILPLPLTSYVTLVKKNSSIIFLICKRGMELVPSSSVPFRGENEKTVMLLEYCRVCKCSITISCYSTYNKFSFGA